MLYPDTIHLMKKIFYSILDKDKSEISKLSKSAGSSIKVIFTYDWWSTVSGNHLFDDYPEFFNITEQEGHKIRGLFQKGLNDIGKDQLINEGILKTQEDISSELKQELYENFPWYLKRRFSYTEPEFQWMLKGFNIALEKFNKEEDTGSNVS